MFALCVALLCSLVWMKFGSVGIIFHPLGHNMASTASENDPVWPPEHYEHWSPDSENTGSPVLSDVLEDLANNNCGARLESASTKRLRTEEGTELA